MKSAHTDPREWDYLPQVHRQDEYHRGLLMVRIDDAAVHHAPDTSGHDAKPRLAEPLQEAFRWLKEEGGLRGASAVHSRTSLATGTQGRRNPIISALAESVSSASHRDLTGLVLLRFNKSADMTKISNKVGRARGVLFAHKVPVRWLAAIRTRRVALNRQWALRATNWFQLSPKDRNATRVKVGVLDTGVDTSHPDLPKNVRYFHDGASAEDIVGHGTHVVGIIAERTNNQLGVTGLCRCSLSIWKIFGDQPLGDGDPKKLGNYLVNEIMYQRALASALESGVQVLNLSISGTKSNPTEELLYKRLLSSGVTIISVMGNDFMQGNPVEYPGAYPGLIAVGASNEFNVRAPFSNTGRHITLTAPGTNIAGCLPVKTSSPRSRDETMYGAWSGTSHAAPHVTAAAAMLIAKDRTFTPKKISNHLRKTATVLPRLRRDEVGAGLLNLKRAMSE